LGRPGQCLHAGQLRWRPEMTLYSLSLHATRRSDLNYQRAETRDNT